MFSRLVLAHALALLLASSQLPETKPSTTVARIPVGLGRTDKSLVENTLAAVDKHYNSLSTTSMHFEELYRFNGAIRRLSGEVFLKKPGLMRWEYGKPQEKLFICDGKTAYLYSPSEKMVRQSAVKKTDDLRSPLRFLLGKSRLAKEMKDAEFPTDIKPLDPANIVIRGRPAAYSDRIEEVWLEVTPDHRIDRLMVRNIDGAETEYRFSNRQENITLPDSSFKFKPPPGVEVVEEAILE